MSAYKLTPELKGWLLRWRAGRDRDGRKMLKSWSWTADGRVRLELADGSTLTSHGKGEPA